MNICIHCGKQLSTKHALQRHHNICNLVKIQTQKEQYEQQIHSLKEQYEQQIHSLKEQYEQQIHSLKELKKQQLQQQQEQLEHQKEKIEKLENQIFEIAKQPKQQQITNHNNQSTQTTNNRILNITNNLVPMDLTDEQIREIVNTNYTRNVFLGGPDSITEMTVSQLLTDQETGKFRIVCTDSSRNVFYYQDCDENLVKDIGMKDIHKKIQKPLVEATSSHYRKIDQENSMNDDRLSDIFTENLSFIDNELPRKLKVKLQLPVNTQD